MLTMGETSEAMKVRDGSTALRTTIPPGIRSHLGLKDGDLLDWNLEPSEGKLVVRIAKKVGSKK